MLGCGKCISQGADEISMSDVVDEVFNVFDSGLALFDSVSDRFPSRTESLVCG
jgi:hypothetical protein